MPFRGRLRSAPPRHGRGAGQASGTSPGAPNRERRSPNRSRGAVPPSPARSTAPAAPTRNGNARACRSAGRMNPRRCRTRGRVAPSRAGSCQAGRAPDRHPWAACRATALRHNRRKAPTVSRVPGFWQCIRSRSGCPSRPPACRNGRSRRHRPPL